MTNLPPTFLCFICIYFSQIPPNPIPFSFAPFLIYLFYSTPQSFLFSLPKFHSSGISCFLRSSFIIFPTVIYFLTSLFLCFYHLQAIMAQLPQEEKAKIAEQVESFRQEKSKLDAEVAKWDDNGNDIIVLAKQMCMIMMEMTDFTR